MDEKKQLKEKGIAVGGKGEPNETWESLPALQEISARLKEQTKAMKDVVETKDKQKSGEKETDTKNEEEKVVVSISRDSSEPERSENVPEGEFVEIVLRRTIGAELETLDGRVKRGLNSFIESVAAELKGADRANTGEINRIISAAIKKEAQKTKLGKFLQEHFQGWDGKFEDGSSESKAKEPLVDGNEKSAEGKIDIEALAAGEKEDDAKVSSKKKIIEKSAQSAKKPIVGSEMGNAETITVKEAPKQEKVEKDKIVATVESEGAKDEIPETVNKFIDKVKSLYFVSKKDISDLKIISYNPKSGQVQFEMGQRFVEEEPEKDEAGNDVATYSIASKGEIKSLPYQEFINLLEAEYVTDEALFQARQKELSKETRSGFLEDTSARYTNKAGDTLILGKYKPGKVQDKYTRSAGDVLVKLNGVGSYMSLEKAETMIKDGGFVLAEEESRTEKVSKKSRKDKKDDSGQESKKVFEEMQKEFGKEGTEYLIKVEGDDRKVMIDGFAVSPDGEGTIKLAFEDEKGGKNVQLDLARELVEKGELKKVEAAAGGETEDREEKREKVFEEMRKEFGKEGTKYLISLEKGQKELAIEEFFELSGMPLFVGFVVKGDKKVHKISVGEVRSEINKGNLKKIEVETKEVQNDEGDEGNMKKNVEQDSLVEDKIEFGEREKKILGAYRIYVEKYLDDIETYDYEGEGYLKKSISREKERQADRFWEVVLPQALRKRKEFGSDELIEKAIEEIRKTEKQ